MTGTMSAVRAHLSTLEGVRSSWFEHEEREGSLTRTLVVEVDFDTDPSSPDCRRETLDAIFEDTRDYLAQESTQCVGGFRIVPTRRQM